jgi:transposase
MLKVRNADKDCMSTISSMEVRQRAIEAYRSGQGSQAQIAKLYCIGRRTFQNWLMAYRQEGRLEPLPRGHNPAAFSGDHLSALDAYVETHVDVSLEELQDIFSDRITCSTVAIHNTLKRLGWVRKKSGYVRMSETDPM